MASGVGTDGGLRCWLRTHAPPRQAGWGRTTEGFGAGYEPTLHPDKRGGGGRQRASVLVTNPRSTPTSGVGADDRGLRCWLRTHAPPRQAGVGAKTMADV